MAKKRLKRHGKRNKPWWGRIPRPVWALLEALVAVMVAQEIHIPLNHLLPLFKWFATR